MRFLTVADVIRINEALVLETGGEPNIRDLGLIESAVAQPLASFGGMSLYPILSDKAVAIAFSLNKNHAFRDGNKRTSHAAMEMFLLLNGHEIDALEDEQYDIFLGVAAGRIDREAFAAWVGTRIVPRLRGRG
jgi:death-on-curing protein